MSVGEWDSAFDYLNRANEEHDQVLLVIIATPRGFDVKLDHFKEGPRFRALVKKMGLENIYYDM